MAKLVFGMLFGMMILFVTADGGTALSTGLEMAAGAFALGSSRGPHG